MGFLQLPGDPIRGAIVPNSAIVRAAEGAWVYAQTGDTSFARRGIALDHPVEGGWFITHGVDSDSRVVVVGAQMLFSEESKKEFKLTD